MPIEMNRDELRRFAIVGAEARLLAMAEEAAAIYRAFPELRDRNGKSALPRAGAGAANATRPRGRRVMSTAQRKAIGERMKRYWASRRGEKRVLGTAEGSGSQQSAERKATSAPSQKKTARESRRGRKTSSRQRPRRRPRRMSAAARKRISEAQKARWARQRAGNKAA